jgi:hypothetical protein
VESAVVSATRFRGRSVYAETLEHWNALLERAANQTGTGRNQPRPARSADRRAGSGTSAQDRGATDAPGDAGSALIPRDLEFTGRDPDEHKLIVRPAGWR